MPDPPPSRTEEVRWKVARQLMEEKRAVGLTVEDSRAPFPCLVHEHTIFGDAGCVDDATKRVRKFADQVGHRRAVAAVGFDGRMLMPND